MKLIAVLFLLSIFVFFGNEKVNSKSPSSLNEFKTKHRSASDCSEKESCLSKAESLTGDFVNAAKKLELGKAAIPDYTLPEAVLNRDSSDQVKDAQDMALGIYASIELAKELGLNRKEKKRVEGIEIRLKTNRTGFDIYQAMAKYYSKHTDIFGRGNEGKIKSFVKGTRNYLKGVDPVKSTHN